MEEKDSVKDKEKEVQKVSRAKTGAAHKSSSNKAKTAGAAGSRPKSAGAAGTRPKSATAQEKKRTSTGRPLEKAAAVQSKKSADKGRSGSSSKEPQKKRKKAKALGYGWYLGGAVVVGLILAFVVSAIMRASMLKVEQIKTEYNAGDIFDIDSYFKPKSDEAEIVYDGSMPEPKELGDYTVEYTVRRGKLSKKKKGTINVVDSVKPYIDGDSEIDVPLGKEIVWSDYFDVEDADPDILSKLTSSSDVDTSEKNTVKVTLSVTDWAGNTSSKTVTVNVREMADDL